MNARRDSSIHCTWLWLLLALVAKPTEAAELEPTPEQAQSKQQELEQRVRLLEQLVEVREATLDAEIGSEDSSEETAEVADSDDAGIALGGALRFNLLYREEVDASVGKRGEGGLDTFRFNIDGALDGFLLSAEYRFYPYMDVIHHGWVGYEFANESQLQLGITQVPFGLLPYASHNSWYGLPYYAGLADDYDFGLKYQYQGGPWTAQLAFFKNAELNDATNLERYAFDVVRVEDQQNEETNQFNARVTYTIGLNSACATEIGGSLAGGELYNTVTDDLGSRWMAALHMDSRCGRWNFQLQGIRYKYDPQNPPDVASDVVRIGAFAGSYDIDSDASLAVFNIAYNFASPWRQVDSIICYNDYSRLNKSIATAIDSHINTVGCAVGRGPLFTYVDYVIAKNAPYFGDGSLAGGGEDSWQSRLNINIGYYW